MTKVLYPGSFDPITKGHMNIIEQASELFDEVIIAVMQNPSKKMGLFTLEERLEIIKELYQKMDNIKVIVASGAAVDVALFNNCSAIIRGLRSLSDYDYEVQLQQINKDISDNKVNTICLFADKEYQFISSSMVKEVFKLGKDISKYVAPSVRDRLLGHRIYGNEITSKSKQSDKIIDMHTHTNYSDGDLSPQELIRLAINKNIGTLAITDHDTIEGIKKVNRMDNLILDSGIEIVNGIELSAKVDKGLMHILGYGIDLYNEELNKKMIDLRDNSINSVLSVMEQIKRDYGIRFNYDDIKELVNANHNLGRPDLAKLCIKYGYASTVSEAFDKYLVDAYNKTRQNGKGLKYQECLELITNCGGIPVLAHPKSLKLSEKEFLILLKDMINGGLKGIEVYHSSHSKEEMDYYHKIANKYDLLISGGSDFHGKSVKPDIELGTGKNNNIKIKELSLLDKLHNR